MSKFPSLISGCNGKPEAYQASRQVLCAKCEATIPKDAHGVKLPTKGGSYAKKKIYCFVCFSGIINQTKKDLAEAEKLVPNVGGADE